jgi:ABC-type antimicrobial peptide transport system permease subunit
MDVTPTESVDLQVKEREIANKNYWKICFKRGLSKYSVEDGMMAKPKFTKMVYLGYKLELGM